MKLRPKCWKKRGLFQPLGGVPLHREFDSEIDENRERERDLENEKERIEDKEGKEVIKENDETASSEIADGNPLRIAHPNMEDVVDKVSGGVPPEGGEPAEVQQPIPFSIGYSTTTR